MLTPPIPTATITEPTPLPVTTKKKRRSPLASSLLQSGLTHMRVALEFFNRPNQPHRYEIAAELALAAWEKVLKAYLHRARPRFNIFLPDKKTKSFNECREEVRKRLSTTTEPFLAIDANLSITYRYRNESVHLYGQAMDAILHGIFAECVGKFSEFVRLHFSCELLPATDLGILPVGYSRPVIPTDFLTNESASANAPAEVINFLKALSDEGEKLHEAGLRPEHSILVTYFVHLEDSRKPTGADLIVRVDNNNLEAPKLGIHKHMSIGEKVRITTDKNAPAIQLKEDQIWEYFNLGTGDVQKFVKDSLPHVKQNQHFWNVMNKLGEDQNILRLRYLDPTRKAGIKKKMYSDVIFQKLMEEFPIPETIATSDTISSTQPQTEIDFGF